MSKLRYLSVLALTISLVVMVLSVHHGIITPPPSRPFDGMSGKFHAAAYAGGLVGADEKFNWWGFYVVVDHKWDMSAVDHPDTMMTVSTMPGAIIGRVSTGNWCGPIPAKGDDVVIASPTGYTADVIITDSTTGVTYRSAGQCERPILTFRYRITVRATGRVIEEGSVTGRDEFEATRQFESYMTGKTFVFQSWPEGQSAPPAIAPQ